MHAAEKFAADRNVRFSTYSSLWIKQSIKRFLESKSRTIHIPIHKEELLRKINAAEHSLRQILGRDPRVDEISQKIGRAVEDVERLRNAASNISLDSSIAEDEDVTLGEICADPNQVDPEEEYIKKASVNDTRNFLRRCLNTKERGVILQRFRSIPGENRTFQKLGEQMGLSAETVRQIEKKALSKINNARDELANCVYA